MKFADTVFHPGFSVVDTHCHYNMEPLFADWQQHWKKAQEHGVNFSWIPGTDLETSRRAIDIAAQDERLSSFIGVHPGDVMEADFDLRTTLSQLRKLRSYAQEKRADIMGIGEIGLDYFRLAADDQVARQEQRLWLRAQLDLAKEWNLPVILHVRDTEVPEESEHGNAYWDTLAILQDVQLETDFTLHCVSGPQSYVQQCIELGAYVGFDGNSTYPNAALIRALYKLVPAERRLLETDAPFLPPQSWRGQVCEPYMIAETARFWQENG